MTIISTAKLKKLIFKPRLFFSDARYKKLHQAYQGIYQQADAAFVQGDIVRTHETLEGLPSNYGHKYLLKTRLALFANEPEAALFASQQALLLLPAESSSAKQVFYWHQEALRSLGRAQEALHLLQTKPFVDTSSRYYRALRLIALQLKAPEIYEQEICTVKPLQSQWLRARNQYLLLLRDLGQKHQAVQVAKQLYLEVKHQPRKPTASVSKTRSTQQARAWQAKAAIALSQLKQDLADYGLRFFLVSGTLLGCVREQRILGHDTDIDVGFEPGTQKELLSLAVAASARFRQLETSSEHTLYIEHTNGVKIDLFIHYDEQGLWYHEGIKCRWWNSPCILKKQEFLGEDHWIPQDYDRYLTENYGDWRTPVTDFATFLDTPNMQVTQPDTMHLYYLSQAIYHQRKGQNQHTQRYLNAVKQLENQDVHG